MDSTVVASMLNKDPTKAVKLKAEKIPFAEYIKQSAVPRETIDKYLSDGNLWKFDPELGYILGNSLLKSGIDGSANISTVRENGARTALLYTNKKPRINTYGDSFTECEQVNDGECWQEYLAGHFGEPVTNFGVGGHGVHQAYRRMLREEKTESAAEYIIFYIWGDDSTRSLYRNWYPWIRAQGWGDLVFFGAKPNVEIDLKTGLFVENENPLNTSELLYKTTDPQWMLEYLRDDLACQLALYKVGVTNDMDQEKISRLAEILEFPFSWGEKVDMQHQAGALLDRYSQRASIFVLEKVKAFAESNGKKLLVVLSSPERAVFDILQGRRRFDQDIVDYLISEKFNYFDMNEVHMNDFKNYRISFENYIKQFFVVDSHGNNGHYNPRGNHFFAYSIKNQLLELLDPKPLTYK